MITKKHISCSLAVAAAIWLLLIPACRRRPETRQYEENIETPVELRGGPGSASWQWQKPETWNEVKGDGLRLVTFSFAGPEGSAQCAVISLPGDGGGIPANVQRWLQQLQRPLFTPLQMENFLSAQKKLRTRGGLPIRVIDFSMLPETQDQPTLALMAAVIHAAGQTLFVKMSGDRAALQKHKETFFTFCQSLSPGA